MSASLRRQQAGETRRELSKILQTTMRDVVDDVPVDDLVTVYGDVSEADGGTHALGQIRCDQAFRSQLIEGFSHGLRWRLLPVREHVDGHVHA